MFELTLTREEAVEIFVRFLQCENEDSEVTISILKKLSTHLKKVAVKQPDIYTEQIGKNAELEMVAA